MLNKMNGTKDASLRISVRLCCEPSIWAIAATMLCTFLMQAQPTQPTVQPAQPLLQDPQPDAPREARRALEPLGVVRGHTTGNYRVFELVATHCQAYFVHA